MKKFLERKQLHLHELNLEDTRFRTSEFFPFDRLALSIKRIGLLQPPLVALRDGRYVLVSGWKRIFACLKLGITCAPVLILDEPLDLKAFLFALYENLALREFPLLEKAEIISRFHTFGMAGSRIVKDILPLLQVPSTAFYLNSYLLISRLGPVAKKAIVEKDMPFPVAAMLAEIQTEDLGKVVPLLLPLGQNKQREVLENLLDISKKKRIFPGQVLEAADIQAILRSPKWPPVEKSERIRLALRKDRFPHLTAWEASFQSTLRELRWPRDISLEPAPFFETDDMEASFHFKDEKEFRTRLEHLRDVSSRRDFQKLFGRPRQPLKSREKT
jgi:hypothetical protein